MGSNGHLVGALQAKHARFLIGQVQERTIRVGIAHAGIGAILYSDALVSGSKSFRPLVYFERSRMSGMFAPAACVPIPTGGGQSDAFDHRIDRGNDNQREYGR
jgi:hypothetical protein